MHLNLKKMLKIRKMRQSDLASLVGVSRQSVNHWCNGKHLPRPEKWQEIADYLGCNIVDLIRN